MGIGVVALQTSQKKELSGPPFVSGSANNGLSVDAVTGKIVLGNDVGDPAQPAVLLSNREIITETLLGLFSIALNSILTGIVTTLDGQSVSVAGGAGTTPTISASSTNGGLSHIRALMSGGLGGTARVSAIADLNDNAEFRLLSGADILIMATSGAGAVTWTAPSNVVVMVLDTVNFQWAVGPGSANLTGADFCVGGSTTYRRFVIGKGAGAYNVDRDLDSAKIFTNSAANTFNLPNMVGSNNRLGFIFRLNIANAAGSTIQAFAGQRIRFGSLSSSLAGTLSSTDVGAFVTITWTGGEWVTESFVGAWSLT